MKLHKMNNYLKHCKTYLFQQHKIITKQNMLTYIIRQQI